MDDLLLLKQSVGHKLDELPDPTLDLAPWWNFMVQYPGQWSSLVKALFTSRSTRLEAVPMSGGETFPCPECDTHWSSNTARAMHRQQKHGYSAMGSRTLATAICPVCNFDYHSRRRMLRHLRYGSRTCALAFLAVEHTLPLLDAETVQEILAQEQDERKKAKARGRAPDLANIPPVQLL